MTLDVWIPTRTPSERRAVLEQVATLHEYGSASAASADLGRGDLLVVDHDVRGALAAAPRIHGLRVMQTLSAGVDAIVDHVPAGVTLCNASGVHDVGVAEWIVMAILASYRHLPELVDAQRRGSWLRKSPRGDELNGATVVIVGHGSIGQAVEARLLPFGVEVVRFARRARAGVRPMAELADALPSADVVIILLPLTRETRGLIDAELLARMKPGALLVNASRGGPVDTDALVEAVRAGRIRVALDVTDPEPLPDGHPLWSLPGALITPHIAGDVRGEEERAWTLVHDQIVRLTNNEPLENVVVDGY